jgi:YVTN family beta-propeller protein
MSVVCLAEDLRLRRKVALKLLPPPLAEDEAFRERFLVESELAASLDHPNVVPIYAAGEAHDRLFIAMRYVEGSDLRVLLRGGPLTPERTIGLCAQVAAALDFAHERGLVHRDVKPSNVLVDGRGHVYLADFGLTRRLAEPRVVEPGLFGTVDYVAPELIRGEDVDGRADVYSLGCLLCECLTGVPPFRRSSDAATVFAHLEEQAVAPPGLERVVDRALAKEPKDRYDSCVELVEATREALGIGASSRLRWRVRLAAAGLVVIAAALIGLLFGSGGGERTRVAVDSLVRIDPGTARVSGRFVLGRNLTGLTAGAGVVWAVDAGGESVIRFDPATGSSRAPSAHGVPSAVGLAGGRAVVANGGDGTAAIFDASSGSFSGVVQLGVFGYGPASVASDGRSVWVATQRSVAQVDPVEEVVVTTTSLPLAAKDEGTGDVFATGVATGAGGVWVSGDALDPVLWRVDDRTGRVTSVRLRFAPDAVAYGAGTVWVANQLDDSVTRIDPRTMSAVAVIGVGREPVGVAAGAGGVWVANALDGSVSRIDPHTNRVTATIAIGVGVVAVAVDRGRVWVAARGG